MYILYRYNMKLKGVVRTKSHPEGSIAEGYVFDESLTYCSRYLQGYETRLIENAELMSRSQMYLPCHSLPTSVVFWLESM